MTPKLRVIAKYSILGALLIGIGVALPELLRWLMGYFRKELGHEIGEFQKEWVQILMGLAVLAGAYGLYRLREKQRFIYAAAELLVAYYLAKYSTTKYMTVLFSGGIWHGEVEQVLAWLTIAGALYAGVSGFDNLIKGAGELNRREEKAGQAA